MQPNRFSRAFISAAFLGLVLTSSLSRAEIVKLGHMTDQNLNQIVTCFAKKEIPFTKQNGDCDMPSSYLMALLSLSSYQSSAPAIQSAKDLGFTKVVYINDTKKEWKTFADKSKRRIQANTMAVWSENDDFIVLAFQGTDLSNKLSIVTDFLMKEVDMGDLGKVHSGFYGALLTSWRDIRNLMKEVKMPKPIYITGHSMGGALAVLMSAKILQEQERVAAEGGEYSGPYLQGLYTFGSPKVGDAKFVASLESLFTKTKTCSARFQHGDDIVPRLPFGKARQLHNLSEYDSEGLLHTGEEAAALAQQSFFHPYVLFHTGIGAHDMRYYLEDTYRNLTSQPSGCL